MKKYKKWYKDYNIKKLGSTRDEEFEWIDGYIKYIELHLKSNQDVILNFQHLKL